MSQIISEDDIFKYVIPRDVENYDVMQHVRGFLTSVPINIFKDEYYILYKAIDFGYRYNMAINVDHLEQMVISNMSDLLKDEKITMYADGEVEYTENERAELIQQNVSATFQMLEDFDINEQNGYSEMLFNIKLYIQSWAEEEYAKTIVAQNNILRDGKKYNRRLYKGIEDANAYYTKKFDIIRGLLEGGVDRLSDVIDTSKDSPEDIRKKQEEEDYEVVASTGVQEWDENYPLARTEMIVVQGGSGAGKTRQAVNIAYNGLVEYKNNILVISLEQVSTRIWPMFVARHSIRFAEQADWLNDSSIIRKELNSNQEMLKKIVEDDLATNDAYGKVRIEGLNLHAEDVRGHLEKVWDDGFHFDIVILDYLGILQTSGGSRYELLTDVVNDLKAECKTFKGEGFLAVLPNQLTKDAEEALIKGDYNNTSIGGSETGYLKRGADYVFTVHQNEEMKLANRMMWLIDKVRLGSPIVDKINLLAFQGQCLYMSEDLEEEEEELI